MYSVLAGSRNELHANHAFQSDALALRASGSLGPTALGAAERGRWAVAEQSND